MKNSFLIPALDFSSLAEIESVIDEIGESIELYKVGMQSFFATEGKVLQLLSKKNKQVFLDLKLNDIPNTIQFAVEQLVSKYEPKFLSLFCGASSVKRARECIDKLNSSTNLISITRLTSDIATIETATDVVNIAKEKISNGIHGVVCSGLETLAIRQALGEKLIIINPGIRLAENSSNDQQRVVTPKVAKQAGATHIVVGRPIMQASNKQQAVMNIVNDWQS